MPEAEPRTRDAPASTEEQLDAAEASAAPGPRPPKGKKTERPHSLLTQITELPILILFAFAIAVVIKTFLVQAFFIPSESMLPTLQIGDRVLVEKVSYRFGEPDRGEVVVFARSVFGEAPDEPWPTDVRNFLRELLGLPTGLEEDYIKRVVAVEGDVIEYSGKPRRLTIDGHRVDEPYVEGGEDLGSSLITERQCESLKMEAVDGGCRVPAGKVFVMGDNRSNSEDSRVIGPIEKDKIVGHAFVILWPPADFGGL